ncbi:MAG: hypothetical protein WA865_20745 [Spirulinaceae cyanobacterium]
MPNNPLNALIPEILLQRFNEAAKLASEGAVAEALEKYQTLFRPENGQKIQGEITGEFMATVELRKAYCLMDLGEYQKAKTVFEELDKSFAGQFDTEGLYEFYFAYGNTLGNLGLLEQMEDPIARAMNLASEELQDAKKFRDTWYWLLYWEKYHEAWESLEENCLSAKTFGVQKNDFHLQVMALEFICYAYRGLGRYDEARRVVETLLEWNRATNSEEERNQQWEAFLESLNSTDD